MIYKLRQRLTPIRRRERWDSDFSQQIAGWTDADWAATDALRALLYEAGVTLEAGDALWTLDEATVVGQVVRNIAQAFGEPVSRIVGGVVVKRTRASRWPLGFAGRRCYGWEGLGTVRLNDSAFAAPSRAEHVLTHELGHYFQESRGLLNAFLRATGGYQFNWLGIAQLNLTSYRCGGEPPNRWLREAGVYEDFAGSFETFVYHQIGQPAPGSVLDDGRVQFFRTCQDISI
jgi:hypothetical protein